MPTVTTWSLTVVVLVTSFVKTLQGALTIVVGEILFCADGEAQQTGSLLENWSDVAQLLCLLGENIVVGTKPTRTHDIDVAKSLGMCHEAVERFKSTHRQSCYSGVGRTLLDTVLLCHAGHDVVEEFIDKLACIHAAMRHDNNHRFNLALSIEIVEDIACTTDARPRSVVVTTTVDEV